MFRRCGTNRAGKVALCAPDGKRVPVASPLRLRLS
jgi:hypothetical protein